MSRVHISAPDTATGATAKVSARIRTATGTADRPLVKIGLAIPVAVGTSIFSRINDTAIAFHATY